MASRVDVFITVNLNVFALNGFCIKHLIFLFVHDTNN